MDERIKITIEVLIDNAIEISEQSKYDYHITDIVNLCYELNTDYTDELITKHDLYIP